VMKVLGNLNEVPDEPTASQLSEWSRETNEAAIHDAGLLYATYIRMKISGVVDRYASTACSLCDYPVDCNQAYFVRSIFRAWAEKKKLFEKRAEPSEAQTKFLIDFDLDYGQRRLQFVIAALNWWYEKVGEPGHPTREQLDAAKARLYEDIDLLAAGAAADEDLGSATRSCLGENAIRRFLHETGAKPDVFVDRHMEELDRMGAVTRKFLHSHLGDFSASLFRDLAEITRGWNPAVKRDLMVRYLGFPFWDVLLYPIVSLIEAGERDSVDVMRMSPADAGILETPDGGPKLKGIGLHHFAAFFKRAYRENDYLWGRLDAAERMISILLTPEHPEFERWCKRAFAAILEEEKEGLPTVSSLIEHVGQQIDEGT
jgi:patatin-related protein